MLESLEFWEPSLLIVTLMFFASEAGQLTVKPVLTFAQDSPAGSWVFEFVHKLCVGPHKRLWNAVCVPGGGEKKKELSFPSLSLLIAALSALLCFSLSGSEG